jgi:hypothetical protein
MAWTKLFHKVLASSIWNEDMATRLVWITMLCMKNQNHIVEASVSGLAHMARVPLKDCQKAITTLEGPDPDDSSGVEEGRRIRKLEGGGWLVINGAAYRESKDEDERRAWMANYMREYRRKRKQNVNNRKHLLTPVNTSESDQNRSEQKEEERGAKADAFALTSESVPKPKKKLEKRPESWESFAAYCQEKGIISSDAKYLYTHWQANGWKLGKSPIESWKHAVQSWKNGGYLPSQKPK